MVQGNLLPPRPVILVSMISITIVGPKNLPNHCMPSMVTVSRSHVRNVLLFLCRENPLYQNIIISEENSNMLPEGGFPDALRSTTQHPDDLFSLEQERAGYVVQDDDDEDDKIIYNDEDEGEIGKNCII
ncbi:hypothetical protein PAXINDRAFT_86949 [Paxillus involutus ATCC 200175]|uniref:DUF6570 domain-containing protein n=1 Tax=Paxillus involutus ATCC 200175 TaxID=664439 RepID=A0A0C9SQQ3_PAXIN|nr:hypothetical protein PAXINDRAFT_86949 [Paxillus involutus ATCC 200175]